jgi:uncharacterized protein (TIGR02569 family)
MVPKPVDDAHGSVAIAELVSRLKDDDRYRVVRPVRATGDRWIVDGWSAWTKLVGEHSATRWPELLRAAEAFHEAIADAARPEFIDRRQDRWRIADRVAWADLPSTPFRDVTHVGRLVAARRPVALPSQLVHCDLVGNVLFAEGMPPGIIDLSLYWRPAGYGAALVVGDAIAWERGEPSLTGLLTPFASWEQLLLRAVLFRIIANELVRQQETSRADPADEYRTVVDLAVLLANAGK